MIRRSGTVALGALVAGLLGGAVFAAQTPEPKAPDTGHGLRLFNELDVAIDVTVDEKPGHVDAATDASLNIVHGKHAVGLKTPKGDQASVDLALEDARGVDWHGFKFWCLHVRYDAAKTITFSQSEPADCRAALTAIDTPADRRFPD